MRVSTALACLTFLLSLAHAEGALANLTIERQGDDLILAFEGPLTQKLPELMQVVWRVVSEDSGRPFSVSVKTEAKIAGTTITFTNDGAMVTKPGGSKRRTIHRGFFADPAVVALGQSDEYWFNRIREQLQE
jgi:hypothetical protein